MRAKPRPSINERIIEILDEIEEFEPVKNYIIEIMNFEIEKRNFGKYKYLDEYNTITDRYFHAYLLCREEEKNENNKNWIEEFSSI